jgi:hypothetical protein
MQQVESQHGILVDVVASDGFSELHTARRIRTVFDLLAEILALRQTATRPPANQGEIETYCGQDHA